MSDAPAGHLPGCDTYEWDDHDPSVFGACSKDGEDLVAGLRTAEAVKAVVAQPYAPHEGMDPEP